MKAKLKRKKRSRAQEVLMAVISLRGSSPVRRPDRLLARSSEIAILHSQHCEQDVSFGLFHRQA
jgi:hypothetical protein